MPTFHLNNIIVLKTFQDKVFVGGEVSLYLGAVPVCGVWMVVLVVLVVLVVVVINTTHTVILLNYTHTHTHTHTHIPAHTHTHTHIPAHSHSSQSVSRINLASWLTITTPAHVQTTLKIHV